ncbi:MAG TPA: GNAT family N-acetyltransferase [Burkholderiales bacterium]|nr:GNAT family N-acetyltransferase [Burkholderiales bacterium]
MNVRTFQEKDWPAVWEILEPVFRAGETYSFARDISQQQAHVAWIEVPSATFVATDDAGRIVGTYYIKPNQPGQGSHVCNCGYVVSQAARGRGIASMLCQHSQQEAVRQGFRAMQYNLVVATNERAVKLWQRLGFGIVGTLPEAFRHPARGFVDAHVMYKKLV